MTVRIDKLRHGQRVLLANGGHAVISHQDRAMKLVYGSSEFGEHSFIWTYDGYAVSSVSFSLRTRCPTFDIVGIC